MFNIALNWYLYKHLKLIALVFLLSVTHIASILKVGDQTCSKHFDKQIKKKNKREFFKIFKILIRDGVASVSFLAPNFLFFHSNFLLTPKNIRGRHDNSIFDMKI